MPTSDKIEFPEIYKKFIKKMKSKGVKPFVSQHPKTRFWHGIDSVLRTPVTKGYKNKKDAKDAWWLYTAQSAGDTATRSYEGNNMKIINSILEKIDMNTFEMQFSASLIESLLTEDLERIASDMWRRTKKAVMTARKPEDVMKKVIKLTQAIATKAGYKKEDVVSWYYDEVADEEIPGSKRKGKLWHEFFAKVYKKV